MISMSAFSLAQHTNIFQRVKEISVYEVAQRFMPTELRRAGRRFVAKCPFHADKNPSFVIFKDGFYCFGCGARGDGIDLVGRLLGLRPVDAAREICRAFGLAADEPATPAARRRARQALKKMQRERELEAALQRLKNRVYCKLCLIYQASSRVVAAGPDAPGREAAAMLEVYVEHLLDVLQFSAAEQQLAVLKEWCKCLS